MLVMFWVFDNEDVLFSYRFCIVAAFIWPLLTLWFRCQTNLEPKRANFSFIFINFSKSFKIYKGMHLSLFLSRFSMTQSSQQNTEYMIHKKRVLAIVTFSFFIGVFHVFHVNRFNQNKPSGAYRFNQNKPSGS